MSTSKKRGLGRGLGALIPPAPPEADGVEVSEVVASSDTVASQGSPAQSSGPHGQGSRSPVDVFFSPSGVEDTASSVTVDGSVHSRDSKTRGQAWGAALSEGRLSINGDAGRMDRRAQDSHEPVEGSDIDLLPVPGARFAELDVAVIEPNAMQPRTVFDEDQLEELAASIDQIGVLQPIVVREHPDKPGHYELIMGERRWRASQVAGKTRVPAIIKDTDDSDMLRDALLENLHRADLNPLEEAAAYRQLLDDFGCTHDELAIRIARSRPQISNTLRLLKLPALVQRRVAAGILSAGHARALLSLHDAGEIERLAQRIVAEGLSVRAVEEIVALANSGGQAPRQRVMQSRVGDSDETRELAARLSDRFDTRVKVVIGKRKGHVTLEFATREDLHRILTLMGSETTNLSR